MKHRSNYTVFRKPLHGFTLVELLVVISIIALLMAVLMPALQKARAQAKNMVCAAQLRQQGVAVFAYSVDHERYPLSIRWGYWPFGALGWNEALAKQYVGEPFAGADTTWHPAAQGGLFESGYIEDAEFFFCPAASKKATKFGRPLTYDSEWLPYYTPDKAGWTWGSGPYSGYPYWVGYRTGMDFYDDKFKKDVAKNYLDRADKIIITDAICSEDPPGGFGTYKGADELPVFANHVNSGKLRGGNILYNDGSVTWKSMKKLMENGDKHWRLRVPQGVNVNFWF